MLHKVDFCVVGGGLSGVCAAIAAARKGLKVAIMHDRSVLGGNASSEIRMWVCGAHGDNNRETGIIEELELENFYRNPNLSYSIWDSVIYEKVRYEENITLILNCSCCDAKAKNGKIISVKGWQTTTYTWHTVEAEYFADCSGDSILAPLVGAEFTVGREARSKYNESIQPEKADKKTMGMSCLFQIRETDIKQDFIPPKWAYKFPTDDDLPYKDHNLNTNFWWIELGGDKDSIKDTEELRDELLKIVFGVWDHMKNYGDHGVDNWVLEWVGFLPGKRESRRYIGDYVLTQNDIEAEGRFDDLVAYGGWSMDDHFPEGFNYKEGYPTIFHPAPSPYGIPYRCLYSKNIENLFFAGRNISVSHAALSSTRVMATCSILGQAVGNAVALAKKYQTTPRGVYKSYIDELKQSLMWDDCYLPFNKRRLTKITETAKLDASQGDPSLLRSGNDRDEGWVADLGEYVRYSFEDYTYINKIRLIFDSNLNRDYHNMPCNYPLNIKGYKLPETLIKEFIIEIETKEGIKELVHETNNYQRLYQIDVQKSVKSVKLIPLKTRGEKMTRVISFDLI